MTTNNSLRQSKSDTSDLPITTRTEWVNSQELAELTLDNLFHAHIQGFTPEEVKTFVLQKLSKWKDA